MSLCVCVCMCVCLCVCVCLYVCVCIKSCGQMGFYTFSINEWSNPSTFNTKNSFKVIGCMFEYLVKIKRRFSRLGLGPNVAFRYLKAITLVC